MKKGCVYLATCLVLTQYFFAPIFAAYGQVPIADIDTQDTQDQNLSIDNHDYVLSMTDLVQEAGEENTDTIDYSYHDSTLTDQYDIDTDYTDIFVETTGEDIIDIGYDDGHSQQTQEGEDTQEQGIDHEDEYMTEEGVVYDEDITEDQDIIDDEDIIADHDAIDDEQSFGTDFPALIITEVSFAGIQEWFELYNPHDVDFLNTIEVLGVRSTPLIIEDFHIPAKQVRVISRQAGLDIIADTSVVHSIHPLSMPNNNPLHITLFVDGELIDTFSASQSLMNQANISTNDRASLQRTLDDISIVHISPASQNYNNASPSVHKINPGIVYYSLDDLPPPACETYGEIVKIAEVFRGDQQRKPYVELFIPGHIAETLIISGSQLDQPITIFANQTPGHYHLITIPGHDYTTQSFVSDNQELSFSSELGNIGIYRQDGQVLDKVDIVAFASGYSTYISGQGCQRAGNQVDVYSPGFSRSYLSYFPQGVETLVTVTEIETIIVAGDPLQCQDNSNTNNNGSTDDNDEDIVLAERTGGTIDITHIGYQGPTTGKSITLFMTGSDAIDMSDFFILTNGSSKRNLRGILQPDIPLTLTGSLGFSATQPRCVELFHDNYPTQPIDEYCYDPIQDNKWHGEIYITDIVYQTPPGSNIRQLHLHVPEGIVDLSYDRYIMINATKRNLTSFGQISGHVVIEGTFPFPKTSNTCVELWQYDVLFDTYCYTVAQNNNPQQTNTPFNPQRLNYPIHITHIHYAGPTTGKSITFFMTGGSVVDMSHFHILINGTTKRNLRGTLEPDMPLTITGSLGFAATQARCVELFHNDHLFHTYCYDPAADKAKEQAAHVWTGDIDIAYIRYETDEHNPNQSITLLSTGTDIFFAHGWYLMINNRKFNLTSFGTGNGEIVLTGNFRFPRTVSSCVTIGQYDIDFTTYCYDPRGQTSQTEKVVYSGVRLEILAAFPNPIGPDAGKEWIDLMLHTPEEVDFSQGFAILINGRTRRSISGNPVAGEVYRLTGTFVLPNAASCFSILYQDDVLDTFCYPQTREGIVYDKNAQTLLALTDSELSLLNATRLTRFDNRICLTLSDVTIKCRAIPAGRLAARQMEELRLSRNYINMIHDYLYNHRQIIYFNTDIIHYKRLFDQSKREISDSQFTRRYGSEHIPISDIQTRFQLQYQQPLLPTVQSQVSNSLFGPKLAQNYQKAKSMYYKH